VKDRVAAQVLPLIESLPSAVERDNFRQQLARRLGVHESRINPPQTGISAPRTGKIDRAAQGAAATPRVTSNPVLAVNSARSSAFYLLAVLFRRPELLFRLDRMLQQYGLAPLAREDFEFTDHQVLFSLIQEAVEQDQTEHHEYIVKALPESLRALGQDLLAQTEKMSSVDGKVLEELLRDVIRVRRVAANESLNQLSFLQQEAIQAGDQRLTSYQALAMQSTRLLLDLDRADKKIAMKRLE
jgi:DNA primase